MRRRKLQLLLLVAVTLVLILAAGGVASLNSTPHVTTSKLTSKTSSASSSFSVSSTSSTSSSESTGSYNTSVQSSSTTSSSTHSLFASAPTTSTSITSTSTSTHSVAGSTTTVEATYVTSSAPNSSEWLIVRSDGLPILVSSNNTGVIPNFSSYQSLNQTRIGYFCVSVSSSGACQAFKQYLETGWYWDSTSKILFVHYVGGPAVRLLVEVRQII